MERCPSCQNLIFKEESYLQLLMGLVGNVRSGWGNFHSKNQLPCSVQRGGVFPKKKKKCDTQRKPRYLKVARKTGP